MAELIEESWPTHDERGVEDGALELKFLVKERPWERQAVLDGPMVSSDSDYMAMNMGTSRRVEGMDICMTYYATVQVTITKV